MAIVALFSNHGRLLAYSRKLVVRPTSANASRRARLTPLGCWLQVSGVSRRDLAHTLGISDTALGKIVRGEKSPDTGLAGEIARALGVSASDLFPAEAEEEE